MSAKPLRNLGKLVPFALCLVILATSALAERPHYALVTILHTNDLHGQVMPKTGPGGLARIATLIRQVRADMPRVLLLDAGDIFHSTPEDYFSSGRATISAMNAACYSASATGNHDYDFGPTTLSEASGCASFPMLTANVHAAAGGNWDGLVPYHVFDLDGVKIAVLGMVTLETSTLHWPGHMSQIVIDDPFATAAAMVPKLRKEADVVVVLSHLGQDEDARLAREVKGIDFIVGGHSHTPILNRRMVGSTLISQAGAYGTFLGRIDFIVRRSDEGSRVIAVNGVGSNWWEMKHPPLGKIYPDLPLIPVEHSIAEDAAVVEAYLPFRQAADAKLAEVIGCASQEISAGKPGISESPAGNLLADALREFAGSDIALIDPKSVGTGLGEGQITFGSVFDLVSGFTRQHVVTARMTGEELRKGLEARLSGKEAFRAQISGGMFAYSWSGGTAKISSLSVAGKRVDPQAVYTVAAPAYVIQDMLAGAPHAQILSDPPTTTREALASYLKAHKPISSPGIGRVRLSL